ncbi:MAG: polyprenyl synthetase family protein [Actinomycetota bacterium]|nr:polyprenyl synthetase family protein [Actinomycetota bacterium]
MSFTSAAPDALRRTDALLVRPLQEAVAALPAPVEPVVAHHLGWTGADARPRGTGGKALRATLALLSAEAATAPVAVGIPGALAVELVHNFSLLHDDVMDGDTERRHRPAAWTLFGEPLALLAGNALLARAQALLVTAGPTGPTAAVLLEGAVQQLIAGQALDLALERRHDTTVAEWAVMADGKSAALLAASAAIGAVLADAPVPLVGALSTYGRHLGIAYQAVDDLLGIWGTPLVTGKPVGRDLQRAKKTLPVVAALAAGGPLADRLRALLIEADRDGSDVAEMVELIEANGGRRASEEEAARRIDGALAALDGGSVPPAVAAELSALALFVTARDR